MKPTVGRIVHFHAQYGDGPLAAIVVAINGDPDADGSLSLAVAQPPEIQNGWMSGVVEFARKLARYAPNGTNAAIHGDYWTWPPREG